MADCGSEHGKVCADIAAHDREFAKVWKVMDTRLATKVFVYACSTVAAILAFTIGWTQANNSGLNVLQQQQAVTLERIDHNREVVSSQYTALKESITELKASIKKGHED